MNNGKNVDSANLCMATKTDAHYVCIEPWCSSPSDDGVVDNLLTKKEMVHLAPNMIHKTKYEIIIK